MKLSKPCLHCGLSFSWRKKWEDCWDEVKYCSERCRRASKARMAGQAEQAILDLLKQGNPGAPLNPDEAARQLEPDQSGRNWQHAVWEVMNAARRMALEDKIVITRKGKPIHPDEVRGVVRLRLK
ncbi:MAG: DUF2256 and DUF3253 domain-containing protein [Verrucomicrobiota bacterium]